MLGRLLILSSLIPPKPTDEPRRVTYRPLRRSAQVLRELLDVADDVGNWDMRAFDNDPAAVAPIASGVTACLERALTLFAELQDIDERRAPSLELSTMHVEPPPEEGATLQAAPPRIADFCFAGTFELRGALRELKNASGTEATVTAIATASGQLSRGVQAVLDAARRFTDPPPGLDADEWVNRSVEAGVAVRQLYHRFRRSLRRPTDESSEAVLVALRYAAGAIASAVSDPAYVDVRPADRVLLKRLRERLLDWARQDRPAKAGLQLLEDVWTCSDLLRAINQRQELRAHDADLCHALVHDANVNSAAFLESLETLLGKDDHLDELIEAWRDAPSPEVHEELLRTLAQFETR